MYHHYASLRVPRSPPNAEVLQTHTLTCVMPAKRKKASSPPPAGQPMDMPVSPVDAPVASGSDAAAGGASPSSPLPFVFSAGSGPAASPTRAGPSSPTQTRDSAAADAAEAALQRLVEACRAGDALALAARLPLTDVNRSCRQGAAAGFSAPPLWWCASLATPRRAAPSRRTVRRSSRVTFR